MFRSVRIQNFRQFKDLELKNLGRINLITGQNNTGKTSLLEALFLLDNPNDPTRTIIAANFRGIDRPGSETPELWEWLFHVRQLDQQIELESEDGDGGRTHLKVNLSRGSLIPAARNGDASIAGHAAPFVTSALPLPTLVYDHVTQSGQHLETRLQWTSQGLVLEPDRRGAGREGFFLPYHYTPGESEAGRFSQLELIGREAAVVDALRIVEPRLKKLTVLNLGGRSSVYADLGQFPLVPMAMMGQGFSKLLTIVSAMVLREGPIYLVDEIDDGFHYSVLPAVWKAIIAAVHKHDVQLFATTHSLEAIEAAVEGSEEYEGSLAFYRLERRNDDIEVVMGEDSRLRSAVSVGAELR